MKKQLHPSTIGTVTPLGIIGTCNEDGSADVMAVAWCGFCSITPPAFMVALNEERLTLKNILREKEFTVGFPGEAQMVQADYTGMVSGKKADKVAGAKLTVERAHTVNAPVVTDFPVTIECRCVQTVKEGKHTIIIGEILNVLADEDVLDEKDMIDVVKAKLFTYDPGRNLYFSIGAECGKAFYEGAALLKQ